MYEEFYGLKRRAFENTPNPEFFFASNQHREALASLVYGVMYSKGFVLVTGDVGTGKTFLSHALKYELGDEHIVVEVTTPWITTEELIQALPEKLEMAYDPSWSALTLQEKIKERLAELHKQERRVLIILDEAQQLPLRTLEGIRLLSNLETPDAKVVQIVLFGQNELNEIINRHSMRQIRQRITLCRSLVGLDQQDTQRYVAHRLSVAGRTAKLFTDESLKVIYQYSRGVPRLINLICDNCLITGFAHQAPLIEPEVVREVVSDLPISSSQNTAVHSAEEAAPQSPKESTSMPSEDLLEAFLEGNSADEKEKEEEDAAGKTEPLKAEPRQPDSAAPRVSGIPLKQIWMMIGVLVITVLIASWMLSRSPDTEVSLSENRSDTSLSESSYASTQSQPAEAEYSQPINSAAMPDDIEALVRELEQQAVTIPAAGPARTQPEAPVTGSPIPSDVVRTEEEVKPLPFSDGVSAPKDLLPIEVRKTSQPAAQNNLAGSDLTPLSMPLENASLYQEYALPPGSTLSQLVRKRYRTWNDSSRDLIQALNPALRESMDRLSANARLNLPDIRRQDLLTQDSLGQWYFWAGTTTGSRKSKTMVDDYKNQGFKARIVDAKNQQQPIYRVFVGPYANRDDVLIAVSRIKLNGMPFIR
ncbi:AAA family ATPase [Marinobacterium jannaschii]|uniref:AAA family ATPase n=1 Tax=Marinobacterium jannaschii TaxID=64970 RepID=UPI000686F53B|nr:AAA family ATPase [Marinobacterium jannaschii]